MDIEVIVIYAVNAICKVSLIASSSNRMSNTL